MCVCMSACMYDRNARAVRTVSTCGCDGEHISGHCPVTQGSEVDRTASASDSWRCAIRRDLKRENSEVKKDRFLLRWRNANRTF